MAGISSHDAIAEWRAVAKRHLNLGPTAIWEHWTEGVVASREDPTGKPRKSTIGGWLTKKDRSPPPRALTELLRIHRLAPGDARTVCEAWARAFGHGESVADDVLRAYDRSVIGGNEEISSKRPTLTSNPVAGIASEVLLARLAVLILDAERIDIAGTPPHRLIRQIEILRESEATQGAYPRPLPEIRCFLKPESELVLDSQSASGHRARHLWDASLTGLRNLRQMVDNGSERSSLYGFCRTSPLVGDSCVIRAGYAGAPSRVWTAFSAVELANDAGLAIVEFNDQESSTADWFTELDMNSQPLVRREVTCKPIEPETDLDDVSHRHRFVVSRLLPFGTADIGPDMRPVALTILRSTGHLGGEVLLKRRSRINALDDFDKLSLFSSRVTHAEMGPEDGPRQNLDDSTATIHQAWIAAGKPEPFTLDLAWFKRAAQREIFGSTHLSIPADRLRFCGSHVLRNEISGTTLGFVILVADLMRSTHLDELASAMRFNPEGLKRVHTSELYSSSLDLNRFLRMRKDWLIENCLESVNESTY